MTTYKLFGIIVIILVITILILAVYLSPSFMKLQTTYSSTETFQSLSKTTIQRTRKPEIVIQEAELRLTVLQTYLNRTYKVKWMVLSLAISIKNIYDKTIIIKDITVDDYPVMDFIPMKVEPDTTWGDSYLVQLPYNRSVLRELGITFTPPLGSTLYDPRWGEGTVHEVTVYYQVLGYPTIYKKTVNVTVT